jgi:hypothetical protein
MYVGLIGVAIILLALLAIVLGEGGARALPTSSAVSSTGDGAQSPAPPWPLRLR